MYFDENFLRWANENNISMDDNMQEILRLVPFRKLQKYISDQSSKRYQKNPSCTHCSLLIEYRDYLVMAQNLDYDIADEFVLYPESLKKAHDIAVKLRREQRDRKSYDNSKYLASRLESIFESNRERYSYQKKGLAVVVPNSAAAIVKEGHALHHCVGDYLERIVQGQCLILFVRKTEDLDTPYFTMQISGNRVSQLQGRFNAAPSDEVHKFVDEWASRILKLA